MEQSIQENLFNARFVEHGRARWNDPDTSQDAAASVNVAQLEREYLLALLKHPAGLTNGEVSDVAQRPLNSISPRSAPLKRKGLIVDTDQRRNGSTVRVITEAGRRQVANG